MNRHAVKIEMKVITTEEGKITGCVLYHEPTLANMYAMCHIRQALFSGKFDFCNDLLIVSVGDKHYPFSGNKAQLYDLCNLLNEGISSVRQLYALSNGRYVTIVGSGLAEEEKSAKNNEPKQQSLISSVVNKLFTGSRNRRKQKRSPMREKCYFA